MLRLIKTSIKTRNLTLLFTIICTFLLTGNSRALALKNKKIQPIENVYEMTNSIHACSFGILPDDTVKNGKTTGLQSVAQDKNTKISGLDSRTIDFQINSDITYLSVKNFVNDEARIAFIQARQKEKEVNALSAKNDSLRKIYANSSEDRKRDLAAVILKNESQTIALNQEIPQLYQHAREIEKDYWKNATEAQINRFQEKINKTKDSLQQINNEKQKARDLSNSVPDTIIFTNPDVPVPEPQNTQSTGVIYKIQLAAAKYRLPASAARLIKKLSLIRQIENYKDEKGVTIYTTGNLKTYKEAATMLKQVKQEGVRNPVIIAYKDGKKIAVNDARKITNEL